MTSNTDPTDEDLLFGIAIAGLITALGVLAIYVLARALTSTP